MPRHRYRNTAWFFAVLYTALSLATEILLLVVGRLRIPQDNAIIAPVVLTVPPLLAAWVCGDRRPKPFLLLAGLTAFLTLVLTVLIGKLTGIKTGLTEPIVVRSVAGALALICARRIMRSPSAGETTTE